MTLFIVRGTLTFGLGYFNDLKTTNRIHSSKHSEDLHTVHRMAAETYKLAMQHPKQTRAKPGAALQIPP